MPYISIKLPPGVSRNGTLYQQKGRWYAADLVRWDEGSMQPIGGWTRVNRNDGPDLSAAILDDGGAFTNLTTAANNATVSDVTITAVAPAVDDAFYIGMAFPFSGITAQVSTACASGAGVWEYYNGTAWAALSNIVDNTSQWTATGSQSITWDRPSDMATTTINSQGPFYYVRFRVTTPQDTQVICDFIDMYQSPVWVGEPIRGSVGWKDNGSNSWAGFGTATKLYVLGGSILYDITPSGFTTGGEIGALSVGEYGDGSYGAGSYGTGDEGAATITEANSWQLDTFGEDLVACAYSDGKIYIWDTSVGGGTVAAPVTDATAADPPVSCGGVVVTPERFVVALAADGQGRLIRWSDQEDANDWTASSSNQSGDFILPGSGEIMCGARNRNETLIWTDVDLFAMRYIGGTLVYSFNQVGAQCGIASRRAGVVVDGRAYWMGKRGFFRYDGFVQPIACPVSDDVFNNINSAQRSLIHAVSVSSYREVWFFYPSAGSTVADTCVVYNYAENHWSGPWTLERSSGFDRGAFSYPVLFDRYGQAYNHERGTDMPNNLGSADLTPSAATGPIEVGEGDQVMTVRRLLPDEDTLGDVDATLYASLYPTASESSQAITTFSEPTSCRITGRQVRLEITQDQPAWRVGVFRLEVIGRGRR